MSHYYTVDFQGLSLHWAWSSLCSWLIEQARTQRRFDKYLLNESREAQAAVPVLRVHPGFSGETGELCDFEQIAPPVWSSIYSPANINGDLNMKWIVI